MALDGETPERHSLCISDRCLPRPVFFIGLPLPPPSPLVVYRKAWTGSPGSACFLASRDSSPKKMTGIRFGVSVIAIKNARGYRAKVLPRGTRSPQKSWRYLASVRSRGAWATQKRHGLPWFQIRESKGTGATELPKTKKAERLQVYLLTLDIVGTHVPCLVYAHVYAGVYACPGLFLPCPGDIQERGRGRIVSVCEKKATEYKYMDLYRGVLVPGGKNREMGATPSSVDR